MSDSVEESHVNQAKSLVQSSLDMMRKKCPKVMRNSVTRMLQHSHVSLSGDDIRDILKKNPLVFKELLEECLMAKQMLMSLLEDVLTLIDGFKVSDVRGVDILKKAISRDEFFSILGFPLYLKQKLLVTACKLPAQEVFGHLPIPLVVHSFVVDDKVYPSIFDKKFVNEEMMGITACYVMKMRRDSVRPPGCRILPGPNSQGLTMDDYKIINENYFLNCHIASLILQEKVFSDKLTLGKVYVKSPGGILEKILYRQKHL